jgi:hypothetical protein
VLAASAVRAEPLEGGAAIKPSKTFAATSTTGVGDASL